MHVRGVCIRTFRNAYHIVHQSPFQLSLPCQFAFLSMSVFYVHAQPFKSNISKTSAHLLSVAQSFNLNLNIFLNV